VTRKNGNQSLGKSIRTRREAAAMSLEDVASATGLTKGYLSKVERNLSSPSMPVLLSICDVLGVSLGHLISDDSHVDVIRRDSRLGIELGGHKLRETLLTPSREKRIQVLHTVIEPGGGSGEGTYSLPTDVEFALVLSGTVTINISSRAHTLGEGDSVTFSSDDSHSFVNPHATQPAEVLWVLAPALPSNTRTVTEGN
jgi:transcriptional regulator with XRE-family HTH domain